LRKNLRAPDFQRKYPHRPFGVPGIINSSRKGKLVFTTSAGSRLHTVNRGQRLAGIDLIGVYQSPVALRIANRYHLALYP